MNWKQTSRCFTPLVSACVLLSTASALAQDGTTPAADRWRPADGVYASPGKDFESQCGEFGDLIIELAEKRISGHEWGCDITGMTDMTPGTIKLSMICDDLNLAQHINAPEEKTFKGIMILKKIDQGKISARKTLDGKFKNSFRSVSYCSQDVQRTYREAAEHDKVEAARKAEQERLSKSEHPRDGVYAIADEKFTDRCSRFGDAVIGFAGKFVSIGPDKCEIINSSDQHPDVVRMQVSCERSPEASGLDGREPDIRVAPSDDVMLRKIDDTTMRLWVKASGHYNDDGFKLSYCSADVQRAYAKKSGQKITTP